MAKTTDIQRQPHAGRLIHISKISPLSFFFFFWAKTHSTPRSQGTHMAHRMTQSRSDPLTIMSYSLPMIFSPLLNMLPAVWFQGTRHRYNPNPTGRTIWNPRVLRCSRSDGGMSPLPHFSAYLVCCELCSLFWNIWFSPSLWCFFFCCWSPWCRLRTGRAWCLT